MQALRQIRYLIALLTMLVALSAPAHAGEGDRITPEMVSDALQGQGYAVESITRTLLGRARIVASKDRIWREVVLDISSGQVLRDYAVEFTPSDLPQRRSDAMPRGGTVLEQGNLPDLRN